MPPTSDPPPQPVIEVMEDLATPPLSIAAWATCCGTGWRFGHTSNSAHDTQFWKMELDSDEAFDAIWQLARARCEELAGGPLRVLRVYANGHTYGLGGSIHRDSDQPGSFTLLYYLNPEWKAEWEGETVFFDGAEEVALAVKVRPNRAVFFDSRIPHVGRAPSRACPALRVTVAWKLVRCEEKASGAEKIYRHVIQPSVVAAAVRERLEQLGKSISIPGFRPGQAPLQKIAERYGENARQEVARRLVSEIVEAETPHGSIVTATHVALEDSGALRVEIHAVHLPDLPDPAPTGPFVRLRATDGPAALAGISMEEASALTAFHLKTQVLDWLNSSYGFTAPPGMVDKESEAIARLAGGGEDEKAEYRAIAERRIRLGLLVAEFARRRNFRNSGATALEDMVVAALLNSAKVMERDATPDELRELAAD